MESDKLRHIDGYPVALRQWIIERLSPTIDHRERHSLSYLILQHFFCLDTTDVVVNRQRDFSGADLQCVETVINRLNKNEPIQYIFGKADFYGRKFIVNSSVLIPRQETEILVDQIVKGNPKRGLKIVDIGTGSGCIAISLKLELPEASINGFDIDEKALACARQNALVHHVDINWQQLNILGNKQLPPSIDIVVSNPPYVRESEKAVMQKNVLDFEPHLALFVKDTEPLMFYKAIAKRGFDSLKKGGKIYFEINEALAAGVVDILEKEGYSQVSVVKDLQQKDRIVKGIKGS